MRNRLKLGQPTVAYPSKAAQRQARALSQNIIRISPKAKPVKDGVDASGICLAQKTRYKQLHLHRLGQARFLCRDSNYSMFVLAIL